MCEVEIERQDLHGIKVFGVERRKYNSQISLAWVVPQHLMGSFEAFAIFLFYEFVYCGRWILKFEYIVVYTK